MGTERKKYYVVWAGHETGVFDSWDECLQYTKGFAGAKYKSFKSRQEAIEAYRGNPADHLGIIKAIATRQAREVNYGAMAGVIQDSIAVDAACSRNPGPVEYQGVNVRTGQRVFHAGPFEGGTNNIGEFLAIVHCLALLDKMGRHDVPIYSDSRTAQAWVRNRHAKTTLKPTAGNATIMELVARAEKWLATHEIKNPILKWDTDNWGEIPADFGRK